MKSMIPFSDITGCGVWQKAPRTLSSLNEAVAALGSDSYIINGNTYDMATANPSDAYTVAGTVYSTGGAQYGYAFKSPNAVVFNYLNDIRYPDFIGAYRAYMSEGRVLGSPIDDKRPRTLLGVLKDQVYLRVELGNITMSGALLTARDDGCETAINLDGGGSSQYYLPSGEKYDSGRKVLNWVYFRVKRKDDGMKEYINGPARKPVYETTACKKQIGSLDPNERCTLLYSDSSFDVVLYYITGTSERKVGFVRKG